VEETVCLREGHVTFLSSVLTSRKNCAAVSHHLPGPFFGASFAAFTGTAVRFDFATFLDRFCAIGLAPNLYLMQMPDQNSNLNSKS
jgi:hypothetical protein